MATDRLERILDAVADFPPLVHSGMISDSSIFSVHSYYILANSGEEELYDHQTDPDEWTNRAADPEFASIKAKVQKHLVALRESRKDPNKNSLLHLTADPKKNPQEGDFIQARSAVLSFAMANAVAFRLATQIPKTTVSSR